MTQKRYVAGTDLFLDHVRCLGRDQLAVYIVLSKHADEAGEARISRNLLGNWAGCGEARAHQAVLELEVHNLLIIRRRPGHGNEYALTYYKSQLAARTALPEMAAEMDEPYYVN